MKKVRGESIDDANDKSLIFDDALAGYMSDESGDSCSENMTGSFAGSSNDDNDEYVDDDDDDDDDDIERRHNSIAHREQNEKAAAQNDVEMLASRENRWVSYARILIVVSLLGSAVTASCLTYFFMNRSDTREFRKQYTTTSQQLIDQLVYKTQNAISTTSFLADIVSSSSSQQQQSNGDKNTFPYFTMNDFETFGHQTIQLSGATMVGFAPIIMDSERRRWESYSATKQDWIQNSYDLCSDCNVQKDINFTIYPFIYHRNESSIDMIEYETTMNVYTP
jgi:hypothetical protein